jgi:hypothetical protein
MKAGNIHNRSGHVYKPSVIRSYEQVLAAHAAPRLARAKITETRPADLQTLVDELVITTL